MLNLAQQEQVLRDFISMLMDEDVQLIYSQYTGQPADDNLDAEFRCARLATIMTRAESTRTVLATLDIASLTVLACICAAIPCNGGILEESALSIILNPLSSENATLVLGSLTNCILLVPVHGGYMVRYSVCQEIKHFIQLPLSLSDIVQTKGSGPSYIDVQGNVFSAKSGAEILQNAGNLLAHDRIGAETTDLIKLLLSNGGVIRANELLQIDLCFTSSSLISLDALVPGARQLACEGILLPIMDHGRLVQFVLPGEAAATLYIPVHCEAFALDVRAIETLEGEVAREERHTTLREDMAAFLAAVVISRVTATQKMEMSRLGVKRAAKRANLPTNRYLDFIQTLAEELQLIKVNENSGFVELAVNGQHWLTLSSHRQQMELIDAWLDSRELYEYADAHGERMPAGYSSQWTRAIRYTSCWELLGGLKAGAITPSMFAHFLAWRIPAAAKLFVGRPNYNDENGLQVFAERLITESMFWLGLLKQVAVKLYDQDGPYDKLVTAYTLDTYGYDLVETDYMAGDGEVSSQMDHCILLGNGELIVPPNLPTGNLFSLLFICDRRPNSRTLQITRNSLRHAFSVGLSNDTVRSILKSCDVTEVPQAIDFLLDELWEQQRQCSIGTASVYISIESQATVDKLMETDALHSFDPVRISPTVLILRAGNKLEIRKALTTLGLLARDNDELIASIDFSKVCSKT